MVVCLEMTCEASELHKFSFFSRKMILFSFLNNPEDRPGVFFYISTYSTTLDGGDPNFSEATSLLNVVCWFCCIILQKKYSK
jgi:hypothetical protein